MKLVIKGSPKNAKREAARHGVPVRNCFTQPKNKFRQVETYCDAPESARTRVMDWLGQKDTTRAGRGRQPGALLHFHGARRRRRKRS